MGVRPPSPFPATPSNSQFHKEIVKSLGIFFWGSTMSVLRILLASVLLAASLTEAAPPMNQLREIYYIPGLPYRSRLDANGVKRGHAFGDIGDSLGGRAKLRFGKRGGALTMEDYFSEMSQPQYNGGLSSYYSGRP